MELVIFVVAAANIVTLRLKRKNASMHAEQESQVVATLTNSRSDVNVNGKYYTHAQ